MTGGVILSVTSIHEDLAALAASVWTVAPVAEDGECPLEAQEIPTPPFWSVERIWRNTTGGWIGIRLFRDGAWWGEAGWESSKRLGPAVPTVRGDLIVTGISAVIDP